MLSDHYKETDLALLMQQYEQALDAFNKTFQMLETAQFERKGEVILELHAALENAEILNRKKRDTDSIQSINEETMKMF
ncbi:hypothetical protein J18TS1_12040 [Oceanobacillus oncorhynchi subsp. incaldanensis]|uniref:hypothetical protein n=1 Tax=Oceanobacillus oncorhynchi TaxID=545501 RepID=UPI001B2A6F44|nr:hypothetical protein [Oceanobacillus oncorhynchi]GIO18104.1 hypothetical protein J18TS1_12040 [Oceanobacillus oncorhynchi subsp. incaldanensis]